MASQVKLYEFAKDNFKDTSSDLEDSLAEVEKNLLWFRDCCIKNETGLMTML